ncbi:hypothetical protein ATE47_09105 [Chryseobacterium sp. IHB B 17019]|uniref:hypothetical protein n=1 Tax=Chryseobacterium sp. IHB B 17019 TaxID=1721091 RepID=UPI000721213F|nr:hypothetical protein [Chryseobacterium sp. IHB B 17019]ALR30674.1 hypothetical protein ATE47_09105 [Chryseobacterium sp. IHB B 17019]
MKYNYEDLGDTLQKLVDDLTYLHDIISISTSGIKMVATTSKISKLLMDIDGENEDNLNKHYNAERLSKIAKDEIEANFPFLYAQASLMHYSFLEGCIKHLITTFIKNNNINTINEFKNLKISLGEFLSLEEDEKNDYIFQLYEKNIAIGIQYGVTRFETLLAPIGLSGKVDKELAKTIFELSQKRNNILHRGGIADRFLIKNCPWLNYKLNDKIIVNNENYEKSFEAIIKYLSLIAIRIGEMRGKDMSKYRL